ncbi:MAG: FAD-dependent oxidoreductase, partial [Candidatus Lindowbacteria bacterium]|nr:FAD-dependent oxidoreductase [Candidatus Lindowbacteria bacterium]
MAEDTITDIPVLIAGAGLSGLSTARVLSPDSYFICDAAPVVGGLCASFSLDGYTFDYTGHLLHLKGNVLKEVEELLGDNLTVITRKARVHTHGVEFDYPFQIHLHLLPPDVRDECLRGFEEIVDKEVDRTNFATWCRSSLGEGIYKHFMEPYNMKLYRTPLEKMSADWVGWIPRPTLKEIRAGAAGEKVEGVGYNAEFRYPITGGIGELPNALAKGLDVHLETSLVEIEGKNRIATVKSASGETQKFKYDKLVSTIPLTNLLDSIDVVPDEVKEAATKLDAVGVVCFNLGIDGHTKDCHWMYFPEDKYMFF